jgi:FlaA1/EpsC-like NDP-sugar epimerase
LALRIAASNPRLVLLLESCEQNLYQVHTELTRLAYGAPFISILGDIADRPLLDAILAQHRPEIIYHAAALKHVPLMEANPLAAIQNNALGTFTLANAIADHGVQKLIMISTDKAVDPHSVMGVSKRLAELVLLAMSTESTRMNSVRLGNVLGSQGSVGLLFLQQIGHGGPVTVTHPDVRRYFLTLSEAVGFILTGATLDASDVWIPDLGSRLKVLHLAEHLIRNAGFKPVDDIPVAFIGLRAGDKLVEQLTSARESTQNGAIHGLHRVVGLQPSRRDLEAALTELREILQTRDLAALIQALRRIVPEYQPSAGLVELAQVPQVRTHHP